MKTVTFELQHPIESVTPQWLLFVHAVNALAVQDQGRDTAAEPFGDLLLMRTTDGVSVEVYADAIIIHTDTRDRLDPDPPHKYTAYVRFEATSSRLRRLFREAARTFPEAKAGFGLQTSDAGEWYAYQQLKIEALRVQIEAEPLASRIATLTRQLESAQNVGD